MAKTRPFGNIRKLKSGRYQARHWHGDKQVPADTTFATKADARAWLARMETDVLGGSHVDPTSGRERFGDFADRWLQQRDLRPRTRDTYASQLAHILTEFEKAELRRITPATVRAWHGRLARSGLHANTVAKVYRLFRTMMDTAVDDGLIRANPVHIKGAAVERAVERPILEWDDVQRIADAIHPRFHAVVWVAATSGLRFGELGGLTRRHVDLDAATLRVEGALGFVRGEGPVIGPPKSVAAHRTVTIPSTTVAMLTAHLDTYVDNDPEAFVFTSVKGSPLLNRYFAPYWKKALDAAGFDARIRFHDLRHLAGTSAATAGASLREVMARMGHASADASLRYLKASERRDSEIADAIERRMNGDLGQEDP
jgi:integrase